ncbi:MAG: 2-oxo acid dehydrogenase subunit E2 [FCB group bacterium]|nr:2-oxo acid dehydrogenase subunit E2 [FCB group bacterium]MBL7027355.1 2-oxo acid dehydrogenase subunit E2 [Candidatus Neomarinimicrobiota bacterium]MBL7122694.1 2-oxo acid dehydrogenase subunit E2 [Candidatus Neomarinimicrobiota bacterium]
MIFDIVMPKMGESLTEGTVLEWKKKVGESIDKDETLLEIATDKVDAEIPSPVSGTLVEIIGEVNQTYDIDTVIARVETSDDVQVEKPKDSPVKQTPGQKSEGVFREKPQQSQLQSPVSFDDNRVYSPLVRSIASQEGITPAELQQIPGSGFRGRVSKKDVLFYLETRGSGGKKPSPISGLEETGLADRVSPEDVEIIDMDSMRKSIAKHMRRSVDTSAHVYSVSEADMTKIMTFISENNERFKTKHGHSLTVTHFITKAVRDALLNFPMINASLDGTRIIRHKHLNIGIAVAVGDGLVVPPVRNAEEKSLKDISDDISSIVSKARVKKLTLEDLEGATFSITNFGVFGNLAGYPIINQPNVAILGVGVIKKRPVVIESKAGDEIAIRQMCVFTLGFDHRLVDGAMGGQFIEEIMKNLESVDPQKELAGVL